jgi:regulator of nonsense transcripts 2
MKQSLASDNYEHIIKEIDSLSLEKYLDEIAGAVMEGIARCKTEKDTWSSVEVSATLTTPYISHLRTRLYQHCTDAFREPSHLP